MDNTSKRVNLWMLAAWAIHAVAWFCPVEKNGVRFPHHLPGWEAFTIALAPLWEWHNWHTDSWYWGILSIASAFSCAAFVLGAWWIASRRSATTRRKLAWWTIGAFVINAYWLLAFELRVGYYLWWASFLLLAIGLFTSSSAGLPQKKSPDRGPGVPKDQPQ